MFIFMRKIFIIFLIGFSSLTKSYAENTANVPILSLTDSNTELSESLIYQDQIAIQSSLANKNIPNIATITINPNLKPKSIIIGLALGGGAAKGFVHIGVIKALSENGIYPRIIAGTSAGSLVGSLYAYGYTPAQLEQIADKIDEVTLADFTLSRDGVVKGQKLQDFVNEQVKNTPLQKLKIPFIAVATDLDSGYGIGFNYGNTGVAVRASCSIPNVFIPVKIGTHRYVDGGLSAPVPVSFLKNAGANFIIAVDITSKPRDNIASGFLSNFDQTLNIMGVKLLHEQLKGANIVISPNIGNLSSFAFDKKKQAIDLGYKATIAIMPQLLLRLRQE